MRALVGAAATLLLMACQGSPPAAQGAPSPSAVAGAFSPAKGAEVVPGGCNDTTIYRGPIPAALDAAAGHNSPQLPYVIADPPVAAGFMFSYPLKAGSTSSISNKILWVVTARKGSDFSIDGHPRGASEPVIHYSRPADSGPGEIYPDGEDVPTPGCWDFTLRWADSVAHVSPE